MISNIFLAFLLAFLYLSYSFLQANRMQMLAKEMGECLISYLLASPGSTGTCQLPTSNVTPRPSLWHAGTSLGYVTPKKEKEAQPAAAAAAQQQAPPSGGPGSLAPSAA